jgi:DNA polymerase-3 subunit delta
MKLAIQQLEQHLAKQLASIYFISSDEILLVQEAVDLVRNAAQKKGFSERVRISTESSSDWGKLLYANAHSLSLFAEQRILELDLRGVKSNQANNEILQSYAENPPENTLLIISSHKLDAKVEQSKWYKAIEKKGIVISIWPITALQLPQWIIQRAKKSQLILTPKAAEQLAEQVEGNLLAASQEIEKLCLLKPEGTLDEHALQDIIANHAHFDIFNLVDSVLIGNGKRSLHILQNLLVEDTEPVLIIWALTRELNTMAEIQKQIELGILLPALFSQFRIWEKRQPPVRAFLKRNSLKRCWDFLLQATEIDRIIKGAEVGNVRDELERLVLNMAGSV